MRVRIRHVRAAMLVSSFAACKNNVANPASTTLPSRTFLMGFSANPPQATNASALATIDAWSKRADAAIMHISVPYQALLSGTTATTYVNTVDLPLANLYRGKGFPLVVTLDVTDGLNRAAEAPDLVALKRSITEPAVQLVYRQYAQAVVSLIRPDYLGLAAETNLIRQQAPAAVYTAMVQMTNAAAADIRAIGGKLPLLYASIQADFAWGPPPAAYRGAETDFKDFPFNQVLALSSYPYFVFPDPDQIPLDYYTRIEGGRSLPIMVVEGGWTSAAVGSIQSSPATQARYVRRQEKLLDSARAIAVFQLNYTDIDISSYPPQPPGSSLALFTSIGFVDASLKPKLALATYDSIFARPYR
jgi:hypothetical protein